jgi:predicted branched-subunit amino acid permease
VAVETGSPLPVYARACVSRRAAVVAGMRDAIGSPALVLGASFVGFGSLLYELGIGLELGFLSIVTTWALPAQVATLEMFAGGAPLFAVFVAVALINFRFLPMTVAMLPILRQAGGPAWRYYILSHFVAVTTWVLVMLRGPEMPPDQRLPYFLGGVAMVIPAALIGTTLGYVLAGTVALEVTQGLVFLNPIFFMLVLLVDLRQRSRVYALLLGAALGPALHALTPTWGLLIAGLIAGTAAFLADSLRRPGASAHE